MLTAGASWAPSGWDLLRSCMGHTADPEYQRGGAHLPPPAPSVGVALAGLTSLDFQATVQESRQKPWAGGKSYWKPPSQRASTGARLAAIVTAEARRMKEGSGEVSDTHSSNRYLLSVSFMPSIMLSTGDNHQKANPCPQGR